MHIVNKVVHLILSTRRLRNLNQRSADQVRSIGDCVIFFNGWISCAYVFISETLQMFRKFNPKPFLDVIFLFVGALIRRPLAHPMLCLTQLRVKHLA